MGNRKKRRTYDREFKNEAFRLALEGGYKATKVEGNLGIRTNIVSPWVRESKEDPEDTFPRKGRAKPPDEQNRVLNREPEQIKRERDILRKAVAIFSTNPDRYSDS